MVLTLWKGSSVTVIGLINFPESEQKWKEPPSYMSFYLIYQKVLPTLRVDVSTSIEAIKTNSKT